MRPSLPVPATLIAAIALLGLADEARADVLPSFPATTAPETYPTVVVAALIAFGLAGSAALLFRRMISSGPGPNPVETEGAVDDSDVGANDEG